MKEKNINFLKRLFDLFTARHFNSRLNRTQYIKVYISFFLLTCLQYMLFVILSPIFKDYPLYNGIMKILAPIVLSLFIVAALWNLRAIISRLHDFNCTGWLALPLFLLFHPALYLLMFVPGTEGNNKYGEPSTRIFK